MHLLARLPLEVKHLIASHLDLETMVKLGMANRGWHQALDNEDHYKRLCHMYGIHKATGDETPYKRRLLEEVVRVCGNCRLRSVDPLIQSPLHKLFRSRVCRRCDEALHKISITKAKHEYKVKNEDFMLRSEKKDGQTWYLVQDVLAMALRKHGGPQGLYEAQVASLRRSQNIERKKAEMRDKRILEIRSAVRARGHVWREALLRVPTISQYVTDDRPWAGCAEALVAQLEAWHPHVLNPQP